MCLAARTVTRPRAGVEGSDSPPSDTRRCLGFLAIHPASHDSQHHLENGRVDHGRSLYHGLKTCRIFVDRAMGHFYEAARQVTPLVVADSVIADRPPLSVHSPSPGRGCARDRVCLLPRRQATDLARSWLVECLRILSSAIRSSPRAKTFTSSTNLVAATRNAHMT